MKNRGQKRADMVDDFPVDKRPCSSSHEFRPSSSSSVNSSEADMETASTVSTSSLSEGELDRDSADGSCNSDDIDSPHGRLRDAARTEETAKLKTILSSLSSENDPSVLLAHLTELCQVLSFCTEYSTLSPLVDSFAPILVKLARDSTNPHVMLLAVRAITYLCDVSPRYSAFLVRHDAVLALCEKLMAIEYMDLAEQCLQALGKISKDQPLACLQAGAIRAVLNLVDFLSTSMQRVALSVVVNICRRLQSENPSLYIEAVPILCNLLQYEDKQLVESALNCLIKIVDQVSLSQSQELLDETCRHGLVNQAAHIISLNAQTTLSQSVYNDVVGMLVKLCSGSTNAFTTLHDLNICGTLKGVLSTNDLTHGNGIPSLSHANRHGIQVHEILKLLNELIPTSSKGEGMHWDSGKKAYLLNNPVCLQRFGMDIVPLLIQMVNSGANLYECFCCLSVINNFCNLCTPDILVLVLANTNFSSFLAGLFTRKEQHLLIKALRLSETCLQKLSEVFLHSFVKEGVCFAIDALSKPEGTSQMTLPANGGGKLSLDSSQRPALVGVPRCFCYAFCAVHLKPTSENACKLDKDGVQKLAMHIRTSYFSPELCNLGGSLTDTLQKLHTLSAALIDASSEAQRPVLYEQRYYSTLCQIVEKLCGREPISTFELVESGILKSLVSCLFNGLSMHHEVDPQAESQIQKRFEVFAGLLLSSPNTLNEELPLLSLTKKFQMALSSLENFPVILSHYKQRSSRASVPVAKTLSHPCFKVRFLKEQGEAKLADHSEGEINVDPFASLDSIERYVSSKVTKTVKGKRSKKSVKNKEEPIPAVLATNAVLIQGKSLESGSDISPAIFPMEVEANSLHPTVTQADSKRQPDGAGASSDKDPTVSCPMFPINNNTMTADSPPSSTDANGLPKLALFLDGKELDLSISLYQAVLQQWMNVENGSSRLWSEVHTVTYRLASSPVPRLTISKAHKLNRTRRLSRLFSQKFTTELERFSAVHDIILLLKSMNLLHRLSFELLSQERIYIFSQGIDNDLEYLKASVPLVSQNDFVSGKLTEKLEQQIQDPLVSSTGAMPLWCIQLMDFCPFLFSFELRCKYFQLVAFGRSQAQSSVSSLSSPDGSLRQRIGSSARQKVLVHRDRIMASVAEVMDIYTPRKEPVEVKFDDEVGTGLGPTLEFYTLVSHEFQKLGHGMWRDDHVLSSSVGNMQTLGSGLLTSSFGVFPRPWSFNSDHSGAHTMLPKVIHKFFNLGRVVAKALQDGRVLDFHFSKAFYKLIIGQDLNLYDIQSFDPKLGQTLLEFQALIEKKRLLDSGNREKHASEYDLCFRNTKIEDLCLDFSLPGYSDYVLSTDANHRMVNMMNLADYVSLVVDATVGTGISKQIEAFKSGFNKVFPIRCLEIFSEEELERLLCGQHDSWAHSELLDNIKFDHGYTASSPPIINLLGIMGEFDEEERKAFIQFVTGAPRLPPGGLASLNPKLTIVRKNCIKNADDELPSVMTCANYLKLPHYSTKEKMREKVVYAIREGQGAFHLS